MRSKKGKWAVLLGMIVLAILVLFWAFVHFEVGEKFVAALSGLFPN